jgi:hypothetical protein
MAGDVLKYSVFYLDGDWAGPSDPSPLLEDRKDFNVQRPPVEEAFIGTTLILPAGGPALGIAFEDALVLSTADTANTFEETLPFGAEGSIERIIGHAEETPVLTGGDVQLKVSFLLCTSQSGVVKVDYDLDKVAEDIPAHIEEP